MAEPSTTTHQPPGDEHERTPGGLSVTTIAVVGAVGVVVFLVIVFALQAWFYSTRDAQIAREQYGRRDAVIAAYEQEQRRMLQTVRWSDREQGLAAIPIDRAMDILAERGLQSGGE